MNRVHQPFPMLGHLSVNGQNILHGGFMQANIPSTGLHIGPSQELFSRVQKPIISDDLKARFDEIQRGVFTGDVGQVLMQVGMSLQEFQRSITSTTSAFPVRENLEAEAKLLIPLDTPVRNKLPRRPGAGKASAWKQVTSLGGGYGFQTTVTTGASSATQTVGNTATMRVGDSLWFGTTAAARTVSSITNATTVVLTATISTTTAETVTNSSNPTGAGVGSLSQQRAFFAETGAPAMHTTAYADKTASYKLLGTYFDVTGFAMAAGANYQPQYDTERTNAIRNLMLNEENALLNSVAAQITPPFGDGTNALGFDGLNTLVGTANGTPAVQIQTGVGALTTSHIDNQLKRLYDMGAGNIYMIMSSQEAMSLVHLAEGSGTIIRVMATADGKAVLGVHLTGYVNPLTGQMTDVIVDRYQPAGVILYMSETLPDGSPTADVEVLPQVELPALAPNTSIEGYTAQVLAPTTAAPMVYPGIVTVFEVLRLKSALHCAQSSGLTAV